MSLRRLLLYIRHLPETSRTKKHLMGPSGEWDRSDYFSAHILDSINFNNYLTAIGNWQQHGKGDPPKPPTPIEKPTDAIVEEVEPAAFLTAAEMRAWKVDVQTPTVVLNE